MFDLLSASAGFTKIYTTRF